jgi:hypothetical protein
LLRSCLLDRLALLNCLRRFDLHLGLLVVLSSNLGDSTRFASYGCMISGLLCGRLRYWLVVSRLLSGFGLLSCVLLFNLLLCRRFSFLSESLSLSLGLNSLGFYLLLLGCSSFGAQSLRVSRFLSESLLLGLLSKSLLLGLLSESLLLSLLGLKSLSLGFFLLPSCLGSCNLS